ncbi:MAG: FAD-dependent oxidoreductase [Planctomycetota bacterium]|jgi:glycine/D-amino acid oxidase-like deaminating enzyme|nr:FAD-dependent oxidoreductase [Planctomycetota bacterium]
MTSFTYTRCFDLCILGAGYAGFAATRSALAQGLSVILIDPEFAPVHEGGRAGGHAIGHHRSPAWAAWLHTMDQRGGIAADCIDPAIAEICAADYLLTCSDQLAMLSQAYAVSVAHDHKGLIASLGVATKSGLIPITARRFIDASEQASLAKLAVPDLAWSVRAPRERALALWLHHHSWTADDCWSDSLDGCTLCLEASARPHARRLTISSADPLCRLSAQADRALAHARDRLRPAVADAVLSRCDQWPLASYDAAPAPILSLPGNLALAVPSLDPAPCSSLGDRFALGERAAAGLAALPQASAHLNTSVPKPLLAQRSCQVAVAGCGTGGAIAAIAAAEHGAQVIAIDPQRRAGGVGTGGGILGYCAGASGGLFESIDAEANARRLRLEPTAGPNGRHAFAKQSILHERLEAAGGMLLGGHLAYDVETEGRRITAVLLASDQGALRLSAQCFIDATGDGDLCAAAGCEFEHGRSGDGMALAFTQSAGVLRRNAEGRISIRHTNYDAHWCQPSDPGDLTRARLLGIAQFQRERFGPESLDIAYLNPVLGLRQSRQIHCDDTLTLDDLVRGRRSDDSIGPVSAFHDSHSVDFEFEHAEMIAWQWLMRAFRTRLACDLRFGMLIPQRLDNCLLACRAAGMTTVAAYCARMQRDIQRIGEAAGTAAALALTHNGNARSINRTQLQAHLRASGALTKTPDQAATRSDGLAALRAGTRCGDLWFIYADPDTHRQTTIDLLEDPGEAGVVAAFLLALWGDPRAEQNLLTLIDQGRDGPPIEPHQNGAFKQLVAIPDWLLALTLLRFCGTERSLATLKVLAQPNTQLHDIRCMIALALEGIQNRHDLAPACVEPIITALLASDAPDHHDSPSRSLWRRLRGEAQLVLANDEGSDTSADHHWQLELVIMRIRKRLAG